MTCAIVQKNGAGVQMANSLYWDVTTDGARPAAPAPRLVGGGTEGRIALWGRGRHQPRV